MIKSNGNGEFLIRKPLFWFSFISVILTPLLSLAFVFGVVWTSLRGMETAVCQLKPKVIENEKAICLIERDIAWLQTRAHLDGPERE